MLLWKAFESGSPGLEEGLRRRPGSWSGKLDLLASCRSSALLFLDVKMDGKEWALAGKMPGLGSMPGREQVTHGFFLDIDY